MIDWRHYWEDFPQKFAEGDFCRQVGRTANGGIPTPARELNVVIDEIVELLDLVPGDRLLDLCCGNGLLTVRLAQVCTNVVGVDFSNPMIQIAREHHSAPNAEYVEGSVLDLDQILDTAAFDKMCMVESLAYFDPGQLSRILRGLSSVAAARATILFSGVLDDDAKWSFFDTAERRAVYEQQRREGREIMGRWWTRSEIAWAAAENGFQAKILPQSPRLNTAHYRFNVLMERG
ncbi:MAG TPA: class I SAM-dependent methyltransferase [Polyangiales bacterium]|jgi:cyclopropane fatty-acyl-phospholipid synthase-like methyltransferase|nr:class I SAM-dependent methyltransferase [Polyangiales bacterium]